MNHVEVVTFPRPGVRAAAAENSDGSFTFYVSAHLSEGERKEAVEKLAGKVRAQMKEGDTL